MADSLLLPVVRGVVGKAADVLVQRITRMWGVDDDRRTLERRLLYVQSLLADAEVKSETNLAVRTWMKALKAVAYKADDVLDDFQYEALRREVQGNWSMANKVLSNFTSKNRLVFRHKASRDLKDVLDKIDELVTEMRKFDLVERAEALKIPCRQTHSAIDDSAEIFGRDEDKELVVKLLLNQQDHCNVQVLPIIGMGGLGKTTLAKMVYTDHRVQKHFELMMWHCVSESFEATTLVRSVIELATKDRCDLPDNIELLRGRLQEVIGWKRFLLVLDDVWNEEQHKWEDDLKPLLCSSIGGSGSMIVVTSRSQRAASIMGTCPPYELVCLSEDDSWELFSKKAFSKGVKEQEELVAIGRHVVKKCKGLPLALKAMGGLMSSKQRVKEWEAIADCNIGDTSRGKDEVMSILKLSYRQLSPEMRQCFAFCAVFPKDYEIRKDMLIQLWIANNFIQEEGIMDLEEKGQFVFSELLRRSFFQDVKFDKLLCRGGIYMSITCSMHDLMHDLAKSVTNECVDTLNLNQQNASLRDVRHMMSSVNLQENNESFDDVVSVPLRTLLSPYWSQDRNINSLNLMSLRALQCASLHVFHKELGNTRHLRYLDLSNSSKLVILPDSVCMLYSLHTLRLNGCDHLEHLPEGMRFMSKLRHIYLVGCCCLKRMPPGIGLLKSLRTLTTFVMDTEDGRGIEELKDLQLLGGRLELWNLKALKSGSNIKEANIHLKQNLNELLLHWGRNSYECRHQHEVGDNKEVLEFPLPPPSSLKVLQVSGYGHIEISSWMKEPQIFQCLNELDLSDCWKCKDLPPLWQSLSLGSLCLSHLDNLTALSSGIDMTFEECNGSLKFFPKLKRISLHNLPNLEKWMENETREPFPIVFPELKMLQIVNCPKLLDVPEAPCLKKLDIRNCKIGISSLSHLKALSHLGYHVGSCDSTGVNQVMPLSSWPSLVTLNLGSIKNIILPVEQQNIDPLESIRGLWISYSNCFLSSYLSKGQVVFWEHFTFLERLMITGCDDLVHWPVKELSGLNCLQHLNVGHCRNLIGSSSEESLLPPRLVDLSIGFCGSLSDIPKLTTSLEKLTVNHCACLTSLPSNLGSLIRLTELKLHGCEGLKILPDGMDGLIALQELWIRVCPGIRTLPNDLLQLLPTLRKLMISGSPELELRCRRGGEYWAFVANIPYLNRDVLEDGSVKGFVKRLVPCFPTLN